MKLKTHLLYSRQTHPSPASSSCLFQSQQPHTSKGRKVPVLTKYSRYLMLFCFSHYYVRQWRVWKINIIDRPGLFRFTSQHKSWGSLICLQQDNAISFCYSPLFPSSNFRSSCQKSKKCKYEHVLSESFVVKYFSAAFLLVLHFYFLFFMMTICHFNVLKEKS